MLGMIDAGQTEYLDPRMLCLDGLHQRGERGLHGTVYDDRALHLRGFARGGTELPAGGELRGHIGVTQLGQLVLGLGDVVALTERLERVQVATGNSPR